jgi:hypothetical protein
MGNLIYLTRKTSLIGRIGITVSGTKMHVFPGPDDHAMNKLVCLK